MRIFEECFIPHYQSTQSRNDLRIVFRFCSWIEISKEKVEAILATIPQDRRSVFLDDFKTYYESHKDKPSNYMDEIHAHDQNQGELLSVNDQPRSPSNEYLDDDPFFDDPEQSGTFDDYVINMMSETSISNTNILELLTERIRYGINTDVLRKDPNSLDGVPLGAFAYALREFHMKEGKGYGVKRVRESMEYLKPTNGKGVPYTVEQVNQQYKKSHNTPQQEVSRILFVIRKIYSEKRK
jgi:hypothetical protein